LATDKNNEEDVVVVKPRFNVYTMMLLLSLCAIIIGCVLLYLEMDSYKPKNGGGGGWPWETKGLTLQEMDSQGGTAFALGPATRVGSYS
jgi:hypothetical protein